MMCLCRPCPQAAPPHSFSSVCPYSESTCLKVTLPDLTTPHMYLFHLPQNMQSNTGQVLNDAV